MIVKKLFFSVFCLMVLPAQAAIKVVCTAAIIHENNEYFEFRKQQYEYAFSKLIEFGYPDFYVVEALLKRGPTFLENYSKYVFYATVNDSSLRNQGINEAMTLMEGCNFFKFDDDDIIIKLTGRHAFFSDYFFKLVENNQQADAWVKVNSDGNVFTLAFAMRYKHMKEMYSQIDYDIINAFMIPIEYRVGDYVKRKKRESGFNVIYAEKLDIKTNILGSTTAPGVAEQVIIF